LIKNEKIENFAKTPEKIIIQLNHPIVIIQKQYFESFDLLYF